MEIVIVSGKGGTGKSSVAAALASLSGDVVLADCDVDAANQYILYKPQEEEFEAFTGSREALLDRTRCDNCMICIEYCRFDAISLTEGQVCISPIFCDGCGLCAKVCPGEAIVMTEHRNSMLVSASFRYGRMVFGKLAPGEENSGKLVSLVKEKARQLSFYGQKSDIIIDGPPGIGCPVIASIVGADRVIIVTEPSVAAIKDMERLLSLCSSIGLNTGVLINKSDLDREKQNEITDLCHKEGIHIHGKIPYDPMFVDAMVHCRSICEWVPGSGTVSVLRDIHRDIFNGR